MSFRRNTLKGAAVLTVGQVMAQGLGFVRNMIIARLLSPHDVGAAAALAIALSVVELLADVSIDKLLIQAPDGEDPRLEASCHAALFVRGIAQAVFVLGLSWPLARLFEMPELTWAFQLVAVGPAVRGLAHLDVTRLQRELRFVPAAVSEVLPQAVSLAVIAPLVAWLGDFRAILFATLLQAGVYVACSHLLARRRYLWAWDRAAFTRIALFGWPLMINGALLLAIGQGDRIAIAAGYPKEDLALWSNVMLLASAPMLVLGRVALSVGLPVLAGCRGDRALFDSRYELCMQGLAWISAVMAIPLILGGGAVMGIVFGPAYAAGGSLLGVLAAGQAVRVCRIGPTVAALACGETTNAAWGNAARLLGVIVAIVFAARGLPLVDVALAGLGGEVAAFAVAAERLTRVRQGGRRCSIMAAVPAAIAMACAGGIAYRMDSAWRIPGAVLGAVITGSVLLLPFDRLRRQPRLLLSVFKGAPA